MKIKKFEDLEIWKVSVKVAKELYVILSKRSFNKDYYLKNQIKRSVESISSNIAEGFSKGNNNEFMRYLRIAKGSTGETKSHLYVACEIGQINKEEFEHFSALLHEISNKIDKLISYLEQNKANYIRKKKIK